MATIEELESTIQALYDNHNALIRQQLITEANLIERTAQLEATAAINTPPSAPVVDRQPEIDALKEQIVGLEALLDEAHRRTTLAERQQRVTEANLKERDQQHEELKKRLENA